MSCLYAITTSSKLDLSAARQIIIEYIFYSSRIIFNYLLFFEIFKNEIDTPNYLK